MNTLDAFVIIVIAALIHSSFQLSISVLTLLSSHTIGAKKSHKRLIGLTNAYVFGVAVMTTLLLSTFALVASTVSKAGSVQLLWVASCGLLLGLGASVWLFYYRREHGTTLWVPRVMARYLSDRTRATKQGAEAFSLGLASVAGELLFIMAPIAVTALVLVQLTGPMQLLGVFTYVLISLSTLLLVNGLIGSGHKISSIQRWRENNKPFLQFIAGSGLIVLGFYVYVDRVVTETVLAAAAGAL